MDLQLKEKDEDLTEKESLMGFILFCGFLVGLDVLFFLPINNIPRIASITGLSIATIIFILSFIVLLFVGLRFLFFILLKDSLAPDNIVMCSGFYLGISLLIALYLVIIATQLTTNEQLENIADTLITTASNEGHTDLDPLIQQLQNESDIDFTVDWSGTQYIAGTKKVQLYKKIRLKLSMTIDLEGIPHTIETKRSSNSNVDYSFEYEELKPTPSPTPAPTQTPTPAPSNIFDFAGDAVSAWFMYRMFKLAFS